MTTADHKALKHLYKELFDAITLVINDWDPDGLISGGAPKDEFEHEVAQIAARLHGVKTSLQLAEVISQVFTENFNAEQFSIEACTPVASRLFAELQNRNLLL